MNDQQLKYLNQNVCDDLKFGFNDHSEMHLLIKIILNLNREPLYCANARLILKISSPLLLKWYSQLLKKWRNAHGTTNFNASSVKILKSTLLMS